MEKTQPEGVFAVGVLTVLSAAVFLFIAIIAFGFGGISGTFSTEQLIMNRLFVLLVGGGVLLLVDAALIFRGLRAGYFLSIILWFLTLVGVVWGSNFFGFFGSGIAVVASPFFYYALYCVACLAYFLTYNVRTYFGV